jgi:hypothetical protein
MEVYKDNSRHPLKIWMSLSLFVYLTVTIGGSALGDTTIHGGRERYIGVMLP